MPGRFLNRILAGISFFHHRPFLKFCLETLIIDLPPSGTLKEEEEEGEEDRHKPDIHYKSQKKGLS